VDILFLKEQAGYQWLIPAFAILLLLLLYAVYRNRVLRSRDSLTGLPNRCFTMERVRRRIRSGKPCTVILIDIDDFHDLNTSMGHEDGDRLLKEAADRIRKTEKGKWFVGRTGGDEFLGILNADDKKRAAEIGRQVLLSFEKKFLLPDAKVRLTASIGTASFPGDALTAEELLPFADIAMYTAKSRGKNSCYIFDGKLKKQQERKKTVAAAVQEAIDNGRFRMVYQPFYSAGEKRISGMEALVRMEDSEFLPEEFIPLAEADRSIVKIGRIVTGLVIRQVAEWRKKGVPLCTVTMNFSNVQIQDEEYPEFLSGLLKEYAVPPSLMAIEITESIYLNRTQETRDYLENLRRMGVGIILDDFGTGYSSISYLTYVKFSTLKLDKSLMDRYLATGREDMVLGIIDLCHYMGVKVVAEGVETAEQVDMLKKNGCDYIQGFYYAKPMAPGEMERLLCESGMSGK
jgi:diguanylate cyclase (GGDEF)-like protein